MFLDLTFTDFQMDHQKMDIILESKIEVINNVNNTNYFSKHMFLNGKKNRMILNPDDCKSQIKSKFFIRLYWIIGHFLTPLGSLGASKKSSVLNVIQFYLGKNYLLVWCVF